MRSGIKPDPGSGDETSSPTSTFFFYGQDLTPLAMKFSIVIPLILGAALQAVAQIADANQAAELVADLKSAPTQLARLNILSNNRDVSIRL